MRSTGNLAYDADVEGWHDLATSPERDDWLRDQRAEGHPADDPTAPVTGPTGWLGVELTAAILRAREGL